MIEREIKILDIDVNKIKTILEEMGIKSKGKYIQDIYTFDLNSVDERYIKCINELKNNDYRGIRKLLSEINPCFDEEDLDLIKSVLGTKSILEYIENNNDFDKLLSNKLIELMKKTNENFSKWVRLRQTGDETTITIKRIVNGNGEYELDAVSEFEMNVRSIEEGKQLLEELGYFFDRHQTKMRIAYDYKNTEIVIDKWPKLPPYIEVEGPTKEEIDEVVLMLGYKKEDAIIINTDDIYSKHGIDVYSSKYSDLFFDEEEIKEVNSYLN